MKNRRPYLFMGILSITLLTIIPIIFWATLGPDAAEAMNYANITHDLGEVFGLLGMTLFALTFILSTRLKFIENLFGGLDKVYVVHGIVGGLALIFVLFHPIFLVLKFIPSEISTAAGYLIPSSYWSTNFGIIALLGMIILIYITLYSKMKYHRWKFTHEFLGLIFLFAVLHVFLVRGEASGDIIFSGYYVYATLVSAIGLGAFFYSLVIKNRFIKNAVYRIEKIKKNGDLFEISLVPEHKPIEYKSGQFIFVRFYNKNLSKEAHPFSIASKSNENEIKIIVKQLGDFTNKLIHLERGNKVSLEGPYGKFHFKHYNNKDQIWIGSGIGITPFLGMVMDLENEREKENVDFYCLVRENSEIIARDMLEEISQKRKGFRFIEWNSHKKGRIDVNIIKNISGNLMNKDILLCGSPKFKESIIKQLMKKGVKKSNIHEEVFDFK